MSNYYCKHCGSHFSTPSALTSNYCMRHPNGSNRGKHELYEGSEKSQYTCKYCGVKFSTISSLTSNFCMRHPNGSNKGKHSPAL